MTGNIILAGVGGQGTVLASKLIALTAQNRGQHVRTAETIGMAQRGGCVVSHVRYGGEVFSPMVPRHGADVLIGFEPAEAVRCLPYLRDGGVVVVSTKAVKPVTASLSGSHYDGTEELEYLRKHVEKLIIIDGDAVCAACGSPKVLNVALLGAAAASGMLGIDVPELEQAVRERLDKRFVDMNLKALSAGAKAAGQA